MNLLGFIRIAERDESPLTRGYRAQPKGAGRRTQRAAEGRGAAEVVLAAAGRVA